MTTKKLTYNELRILRNEILGLAHVQKDGTQNIIIVGLKNEDITLGVSHKLTKIVAKIEEEFKILDISLKEIKGGEQDPVALVKREELWKQELEFVFEPIEFSKIEDLTPRKNYLGEKFNYEFLIKTICE